MTLAGCRSMTRACGMRNGAGTRPPSSSGGSGCGWRPPGGSPAATESKRSHTTCGSPKGRCGLITDPPSPRQPYEIHPAIAAVGRAQVGDDFQHATDRELAAFWGVVAFQAGDEEARNLGGEAIIRAGISAAPYLLRLGHWKEAAAFLETALIEGGRTNGPPWSPTAWLVACPHACTSATCRAGRRTACSAESPRSR